MLGMIWAQGHSHTIGKDGTMPWHVPEDLRFFQRVTTGHPVIMGRRTWESLGEKYRPLPGRTNIVVARNPKFAAPGAAVVGSLDEALALAIPGDTLTSASGADGKTDNAVDPTGPLVWVMGGAQIYEQALPLADFAVVTHVDLDVPGADAFAPEIPAEWSATSVNNLATSLSAETVQHSHDWNTSVKGTRYRFTVYARPGFTPPASLDLPNSLNLPG